MTTRTDCYATTRRIRGTTDGDDLSPGASLETDVPATAFAHFQEDINRARAILNHANSLPTGSERRRFSASDPR